MPEMALKGFTALDLCKRNGPSCWSRPAICNPIRCDSEGRRRRHVEINAWAIAKLALSSANKRQEAVAFSKAARVCTMQASVADVSPLPALRLGLVRRLPEVTPIYYLCPDAKKCESSWQCYRFWAPEPSSLVIFGTGLLALIAMTWRKKLFA